MEELVIATNNQHKVEEIRRALGDKIKLISLKDLGCREEIPEDGTTLKENAYQKAKYIWDKYNKNCFADDTGLMVEALDGAPGVYSARYAGEYCSFDDNIDLLLENMEGKTNRNAYFATVICLIQDGEPVYFEGKCEGCILTERYGRGGFGYDPIFMPKGYGESFAEISMEEKNKISHRGKATE
ncbi:MAG: RdgB/HAM1 family non-canonical purine NTP pyrophosphatase, partial [Bacteroidales bacterium]|nr:RdgB/HAM1 family non-canonical purine NTP pyrophosphatase [Bacteroidales bacterium]